MRIWATASSNGRGGHAPLEGNGTAGHLLGALAALLLASAPCGDPGPLATPLGTGATLVVARTVGSGFPLEALGDPGAVGAPRGLVEALGLGGAGGVLGEEPGEVCLGAAEVGVYAMGNRSAGAGARDQVDERPVGSDVRGELARLDSEHLVAPLRPEPVGDSEPSVGGREVLLGLGPGHELALGAAHGLSRGAECLLEGGHGRGRLGGVLVGVHGFPS
jgi:hypothetical protein